LPQGHPNYILAPLVCDIVTDSCVIVISNNGSIFDMP
jgi:hypothetical protein